MLTQEQALNLFRYENGVLFWIKKYHASRKKDKSDEAGTTTTGNYKKVCIAGKKYYAHRIIFLMHHGYFPEVVDHIDGDPSNNKIENLRASDKSKNAMNAKLWRTSTSGHRGVIKSRKPNRWCSRVQVNKKNIYLGTFDDFELACLVADEARILYYGEHARI